MVKCENPECNNESQMDVYMPLPIGMFRADMCIDCGLTIQDNIKLVQEIIKRRAEKRGIILPTKLEVTKKLCEIKEEDYK